MDYKVVSSDDHVQEPGDLWIKRAPAKLRDRVPVLKRTAAGDCWFLDGKMTGNLGMSVQAGHKFEEYKASKVYWEEARKGCWRFLPEERKTTARSHASQMHSLSFFVCLAKRSKSYLLGWRGISVR